MTTERHHTDSTTSSTTDSTTSNATERALTADGISVNFDGTHVLSNVTLDLAPGESVCLIGRSGSGKSTLLRALMGLVHADAGTVQMREHTVIGFQDSRLLPWLPVWKNIVLGLGLRANKAAETARAALADVGLERKWNSWPDQLSGGQAQRVALARALVRKPELLLLDEPFGALDSLTRIDMQDLLDTLHHDQGWALLMVTHDIAEAVRLADRILILADGQTRSEFRIERSHLDSAHRPHEHARIEDEVRAALG